MDWLVKLLPTIGSLLVPGGPLLGAAVEAVGSALGLSEKTEQSVKDVLSSGRLTPEAMQALKQADNDLRLKLEELGIKAEELAVKDRSDARAMQSATHSWVPSALACVVTIGFFAILIGLLTGWLKLWESTTLSLLIGSLSTAFSSVLAFYYGASFKTPEVKK